MMMKHTKELVFLRKTRSPVNYSRNGSGWLTCRFFNHLPLTLVSASEYHCALMLDRLPEQIEPMGLADVGRSFRGVVPVDQLDRLAPLLASKGGELEVELVFDLDERRIRTLKGRIRGKVSLVCQRCLGTLDFPLDLAFSLGIINSDDEVVRLPEGYEPMLVTGDPLKTFDVIEDEVLLAVPSIPIHEGVDQCHADHVNQPVPEKENPFAVLEKLKR